MAVDLEGLPLPDVLPSIPNGWRYESLGDLVEERGVSYGIVQPGSETTDGVPIVRVNNIRNGRIDTSDVLKVESDIESKFQRSRLRGGEVLLTLVGTLGEVAIVPDVLRGWNVARAVGVIPVRKDPGSLWVSICLRSAFIQHCIRTWATTTVQATFNLRDLAKLPIPIPPTDTREAVAQILGTLDDKIELNRRMNATLEAMARALFQSWFVDFDPVRAKLDGRQPAGLDASTAGLFPAKFQESPLGPIPYGWRACTLGEMAKNVSITYDFQRTPEVVFINTGDVLKGDFLHSKRSAHAGLPGQAKKSIRPDDILFSEIRPANKRYAYVDFDSSGYVVSTKFMIIRGSKEIHPRLLYRILTAKETLDEFQVQAESRSGTFPQITFDSISHLPIVLPTIEVQEGFQRAVGNFDARIKINKQQSRALAALRDALLPKLLSGELRVPDAECTVGSPI